MLSPARLRTAVRGHLARIPFRARLAAAFGGLFLLAGAGLLGLVTVLARRGIVQRLEAIEVMPTADDGIALRKIDLNAAQTVSDTAIQQIQLWSGIGLLLMTGLSALLGWWLAGRALRPVAAVTDAARRIGEQNLHERIRLTGPDDELHRLADTFDTMLDRLEKSFDSQRRFVANASHELRTPLAVQRALLEVGLADPLPPGLADVRDDLLTSNRDAERLLSALLLLARSDRGLEETEPVDLAALARQVVGELRPSAEREGIQLTLSAHPLNLDGDPVLLRHLLTNLVRNAIQYNEPDGRLEVRISGRTLTVTNTGRPLTEDELPALFAPFQRLGQERTATEGHGLGLSIVRSIATAHGATVTAQPGAAGGLIVRVGFRPE